MSLSFYVIVRIELLSLLLLLLKNIGFALDAGFTMVVVFVLFRFFVLVGSTGLWVLQLF